MLASERGTHDGAGCACEVYLTQIIIYTMYIPLDTVFELATCFCISVRLSVVFLPCSSMGLKVFTILEENNFKKYWYAGH